MLGISRDSGVYRAVATVFAVSAFGLGILCLLAQIFMRNFLFEMSVSFLPQILVLVGVATVMVSVLSKRAALAGALLVIVAGWPVWSFSKFERPSEADCPPSLCLTVMTANVHRSAAALQRVSALSEQIGADVIALNEPPAGLTEQTFRSMFTDLEHVIAIDRGAASVPIALLSRSMIDEDEVFLPARSAFRAYLQVDLAEEWSGLRVVTTHPMIPVTPIGISARETMLESASDAALESETFILLGDFNLTPWSRQYRRLPGKRAGDPRFMATWPTRFGPLGIPIDHIMFSDDLELVDTQILPPIGSDHRAIMARFKRKTPE